MCFFAAPFVGGVAGSVAAAGGGAWASSFSLGSLFSSALSNINPLSLIFQGLSAYGNYQQQKGMAEYNAAVARNNQILAERQAKNEEATLDRKLEQLRVAKDATRGSVKAIGAGKGLLVDDPEDSIGSALADVDAAYTVDVQNTKYNVATAAWAYRAQSTDYANQVKLNEASAPSALGSLLTFGASSLKRYGKYVV